MNITFLKAFKSRFVILFLILFLGLVLRLVNIGEEPFWGDEILSLDISRSFDTYKEMIDYVSWVEVHPPGYYILLKYWISVFGISEASARMPSVIFGLGTIILAYLLSLEVFKNRKIALFSAFLVAILPIQVEYSQEARPYIIFTFFGIFSVLMMFKYFKTLKPGYLILYSLGSAIGLYLHYSYVLILITVSLFWLFVVLKGYLGKARRFFFPWLFTHAFVLFLFYFWLDAFLYKMLLGQYTLFGTERVTSMFLRDILFIESAYNQLIWIAKDSLVNQFQIFAIFLLKILIVFFIFYLIKNKFYKINSFGQGAKVRIYFILWIIIFPVLIFLFFPSSQQYTDMVAKHILFVSIFLVICLGVLLTSLSIKPRLLLFVIFFASILNSLVIVLSNDGVYDFQFSLRNIGEHIANEYEEGDIVLIAHSFTRTDFNYYLPDHIESIGFYPLNLVIEDFFSSRTLLGIYENETQLRDRPVGTKIEQGLKIRYLLKKHNPKRVWFVFFGNDCFTDSLLSDYGFKKIMGSYGKLLMVDLYEQRDASD